MADNLRAWFRWQGKEIVKRLERFKQYFAEASIGSTLDREIQAALDVTAAEGIDFISDGMLDGYVWGYADLNANVGLEDAFSLQHPDAVQWARDNAAVDVSKVNDTTKKHIRNLIEHGLDEGESYSSVARSIKSQFEEFAVGAPQQHISSRAEMVAVTEMGNAYEAGARRLVDEIEAAGITMEKRRGGPNDGVTSDECRADLQAGWIPADEAFPSGIMDGLHHPGCRHHTQYRVSRNEEE